MGVVFVTAVAADLPVAPRIQARPALWCRDIILGAFTRALIGHALIRSADDNSFEHGNACPGTGTRLTGFLSNVKAAPSEAVLPQPWHEPCLTEALAANPKASAPHNNNHRTMKKFFVRLNRSCDSLYTAFPERSSGTRLLLSGILLPWFSHGCCSPALISLHVIGFERLRLQCKFH